jgi:hypothetical protein
MEILQTTTPLVGPFVYGWNLMGRLDCAIFIMFRAYGTRVMEYQITLFLTKKFNKIKTKKKGKLKCTLG